MKVPVEFVGYVRKSSIHSRALVCSAGLYYTWKDATPVVEAVVAAGGADLDSCLLTVATNRQVVMGRNNGGRTGVDYASVSFCGVIQRCKKNMRVLVCSGDVYYTVPVSVESVLERGSLISVDRRKMKEARQDQIDAGLGKGTLKRNRRKALD
jgi:hypothetical protein